MAGHSQFKNIMHRKGRVDAVRSKVFSKLAREITVAAKMGMPDPANNPRLRAAVLAARVEGMPKDNIQRAIDKFPKQGSKTPWRLYQNYALDIVTLPSLEQSPPKPSKVEQASGSPASLTAVPAG